MAELELSEEAETLAVPAQQSLGLEDQQGLFPMGEATRQEEEPEAVSAGEMGFLHLAARDDQSLTELRILRDQLGSTEGEIRCGAQEEGRASWLIEMIEGLLEKREEVGGKVGMPS